MKTPWKKGHIFLALIGFAALFLFCPRKLSWLLPVDSITGYSYQLSYYEDSTYSDDVAPLLSALNDTYVIWTGWTHSVEGDGNDIFVQFFSENGPEGTLYALGDSKTIYFSNMGALQKYHTFDYGLLELLERSGAVSSSGLPNEIPGDLSPSP